MSTPRRPAPRSRGAPMTATAACGCIDTQNKRTLEGGVINAPRGNHRGPIRVLLADDESLFLDYLRPLIERQPGLAVVGTAEDGLAAIERTDELEPDALVIDLHMPRLDGVSAVARLRRDHPSMCVIALTGDEAPALHRAVAEAGADAVLVKDEFVDVLVDRLASAREGIS